MPYFVVLFMLGLLLGLLVVASSPSPFYAAFGLVLASGSGCVLIAVCGGTFLSLVLFLIYLGGMLVVFAYSSALASEPYPEAWSKHPNGAWIGVAFMVGVSVSLGLFWYYWYGGLVVEGGAPEFSFEQVDTSGVAVLYSSGGWLLMVAAWALLLTLFVVLEVVRGSSRGALRTV